METKKSKAAPKKRASKKSEVKTNGNGKHEPDPRQMTLPAAQANIAETLGFKSPVTLPAPIGGPYVARIKSDVKGGIDCPLGRHTLIIGPNGSDKSAVVAAVELALSGKASDISGRPLVAEEARLLTLGNGKTLSASAVISGTGGTTAMLAAWSVGTGRSKKATHTFPQGAVDPERVFPLRSVREAVLGSADTARRFFLQHAVGRVSASDVLAKVPAELHGKLKQVGFDTGVPDLEVVGKLLAAIEGAKKQARAKKAESKASETVVTEVTDPLPPEPPKEQIEEASKLVSSWQNCLTVVAAAASLGDTPQRLQAYQQEAATTRAQIEDVKSKLPAEQPQVTPLDMAVKLVVEANAFGSACCIACATSLDPSAAQHRKQVVDMALGNAVAAKQQRDAMLVWLTQAESQLRTSETMIVELQERMKKAEGAPSMTIAEARAGLDKATTWEKTLAETASKWKMVHATKTVGESADEDVTVWKTLVDTLDEAVAALLDKAVASFEKRVQRYLPPTECFALRLRDGEREVLQFGLKRGENLHTALSGAEWARVMAALAMTVAEGYEGLKVVVVEDRAFDPNSLELAMRAFAAFPGQVFITHPTPPSGLSQLVQGLGWSVIDTAKGEHKQPEVAS